MMAYNRHERLIPARAGKTRTRLGRVRAGRAHPRAGGENTCQPVSGDRVRGSSPRGRGKLRAQDWRAYHGRLIPARAGKTSSASWRLTAWAAHPRAGGENAVVCIASPCSLGSSPRGRGKPEAKRRELTRFRLIPARAGKTTQYLRPLHWFPAHPRAGGENQVAGNVVLTVDGSSPRGRGKRRNHNHAVSATGLIPARAGKTERNACYGPRMPAHPRAGGENVTGVRRMSATHGSSPRGRGKQAGYRGRVRRRGLIPARAGKTFRALSPASRPWAHPRAGGENDGACNTVHGSSGSSPRGRGKLRSRAAALRASRLIPARAGKTSRTSASHAAPRAHPRAGGENRHPC